MLIKRIIIIITLIIVLVLNDLKMTFKWTFTTNRSYLSNNIIIVVNYA